MPQQLFTQSGVFIAQSTSATIEAWGNGAGGGGGSSGAGGGAGGGGAYSRDTVALIVGKSYSINIPNPASGGATNLDGADGTAVAFVGENKTVSAAGGTHGVSGVGGGTGGAGGTAAGSIGATKFSGGAGASDVGVNGTGGGSSAGTASNGNAGSGTAGGANPGGGGNGGNGSTASNGPGLPGFQPGGGGAGGAGTTGKGGNGAPGQILISWGVPTNDSALAVISGPPMKGAPWFHVWPDHDGFYRGPVPTTGTPKTFYFLSDKASLSNHGAMREGPQIPAPALFTAWASRNPSLFYWKMKFGQVAQPNDGVPITTPLPDGNLDNSIGDCLRTQKTYTGSFRDDLWTVNVLIQSSRPFMYVPNPVNGFSIAAASATVRMRLFRSSDPTGQNPKEIATNYNQVELSGQPSVVQLLNDQIGAKSDATPYVLTAHFKPGHFSLSSEYLFLETAIFQQVSGGNLSGAFGFQWNAFTGANSGVTTPAFTDSLVGIPGNSAPTMPGFTMGPDIRSPYFKSSPFQTDIQSIRPTDFSQPNVIQAFPPPFTTGPMPGPWGGPFTLGDTGMLDSRVAGPPGTRTFAPPFFAGPDPRTPWFSPHFMGRDDAVAQPIGITPTAPISFLHLISRDPIDDPRLRQFVDQVTNILNSLIMQGVLSRKDLFNWQLNIKPPTTSGVGPPSGLFDFTRGYNPGMVYVDMQSQTAWLNLANTPQGHALWQNVKNGTIVGG